jgi:peptide/nickel transport system permease protein
MKNKILQFPGLILSAALLLIALLGPFIFQGDPAALGQAGQSLQPPSSSHLLGTDVLGRDVLLRLVHGARVSLFVGWVSVLLSVLIGTIVGMFAGLSSGKVDWALMGLTDIFMAFPRIFLILLLVSLSAPSLFLVMVVIGVTGWMQVARMVRAETLSLRERDFVRSAEGLGLTPWRVAASHILPNLMPTVIVALSLRIGGAILTEAFLSFLGLGAQEPLISWGGMIQQGRGHLLDGWWLTTFPGLAITLTVIGYNLLGDGLREKFDPRGRSVTRGDRSV